MKIIIHALGANMGGAIRHLTNFLPVLGDFDKKNEYYILIRESAPALNISNNIKIIRISNKLAENWILRIIYDVIELPLKLKKENFSLIISLTNFGPIWTKAPHIYFQRNPIYYCNYFLQHIRGSGKFEILLRRKLAVESMKCAAVIVTPSNSMAGMIKSMYPFLNAQQFTTLYHGFSIQEKEVVNSHWENILSEDKRIKILYPTHPAPHKGFEVLFEALSKLKKKMSNFVLYTTIEYKDWPKVVGKYEEQIKQLGIEDNVVFTGRIPQDQMQVFYKNCDLMVYPSLCESFGFSMVEAMGYGLPIVASDTEVNKEICGDAAIYYSAFNPEEAANKIFESLNESLREDLRLKAKVRIESFDWSWERYVKEFLTIVDNLKKS